MLPRARRPVLRPCAGCAEQTTVNLHCVRCHTPRYCSRSCQVTHWSPGRHKKACTGLARARLDTNLEVQSRALAHVAHMGGGTSVDLCCLFFIGGGGATDQHLRGCAYR